MEGTERTRQAAPSNVVEQNVDAIAALMSEEAKALTRHQRAVERVLRVVTTPGFLYGVVASMALWVVVNLGEKAMGHDPADAPPFNWMQMVTSVVALIMTIVVAITQSRQGRIAERNAHLDLQVSLLVDQKVAKIIELLEEMRRDLPTLRNRVDAQAEELQVAVDPTLVAAAIADRLADAESELLVPTKETPP